MLEHIGVIHLYFGYFEFDFFKLQKKCTSINKKRKNI